MELTLQILLSLLALICLLGGANLLLKGTASYVPDGTPPMPILDNLMRFLSGIYFSLGFLVAWVVVHLAQQRALIYFIGLVVIFSGLGRFYSRVKVGSAGKYFDVIMCVELALGLAVLTLEFYR